MYEKPELTKYGSLEKNTLASAAADGTPSQADCALGACNPPAETDKC